MNAPLIARGNGRAYGDSALQPHATVIMTRFNHILEFDARAGHLVCESGVLLADLLSVFVPRGFFPPVSPGTKFVTIGGMIAADVHGKNHHCMGSFGAHIAWLDLMIPDGSVIRCSRSDNPDLYSATIGGMGLTGIILRAAFKLIPIETAYVRQETILASNLDEVMDGFENSRAWTYSVAWIDCLASGRNLGRSVLHRGEHAKRDELPAKWRSRPLSPRFKPRKYVPFDMPSFALNRYTVSKFNEFYYRKSRKNPRSILDYDSYFYPLDSLLAWNRIYGRHGFVQYQCVFPKERSRAGLSELLSKVSGDGSGSFMSVLKLFGKQAGTLSFPMEGYTIAFDLPATPKTFALLVALDDIVKRNGGRVYLAKDARTTPAMIEAGYDSLNSFRGLRSTIGATNTFISLQSERLKL